MKTICVLLWKNLMVTKQKPFGFIYQMLYPLFVMFLMYFMKDKLKPKALRLDEENIIKYTVEKFPEINSSLTRCLLYTPNSELAGTLMDEVGYQLGLSSLTGIPRPDEVAFEPCQGYYPYTNYDDVAHLVSNFDTNEAIIIFEDMDAETWSSRRQDRLTYIIRMKGNFSTNIVTPYDDSVPQDHPDYGDIYENFTRIQWAVDISYIKLRSGTTVPQKLSLQEFPYNRRSAEQVIVAFTVAAFLFACCWIGLLDLFSHVLTRMMVDRATGIQEMIKINGVSGFTLGASYFISCLPMALMFSAGSTVLLKKGEPPLIEHTGGVIILIGLTLYAMSIIACGMACSYLAHSSRYATLLALFTYAATVLVARLLDERATSRVLVMATGLVLHIPVNWILMEIAYFEAIGKPLTFEEIGTSHLETNGSIMSAYVCLSLQSLIFLILAWYMSHVRQGEYGNSQPWYFCCKKGFWANEELQSFEDEHSFSKEDYESERDDKYFEIPHKNMDAGIRIVNVSKFYPKHKALKNISLDVYRGEITILLGHNGAGKTTLMSIICGMIPATKGSIYVNEVDTRSEGLKVRKEIGFCPQNNLFLPNLNVLKHVMFFHMLKTKSSIGEARNKSKTLLDKLGLADKVSFKPENLSGGMKRRLQLACALAGGSNVLVLDEPTSGLDVETRRQLWDLLLSLREGHTVLLSTHFMEEADALGDRVAALHTGQLKCHATPMFLKKAMGTGYRLSITTTGVPRQSEITRVIQHHVSNATVKEKTSKSITYNLPASATSKFPALFSALEKNTYKKTKKKCCTIQPKSKRGVLGIDTIGLGVSTLEEAFLRLCSDTKMIDENEMDCTDKVSTRALITGAPLYGRQVFALLRRHFKFMKAIWIMYVLFNIIIPWALLYWLSGYFNNPEVKTQLPEPDLLVNLSMYHSLPERRVLLNVNKTEKVSRRLMDKYADVMFSESDNIKDDLIAIGTRNIDNYSMYLIGVELDDQHAKALYTTVYRHAAPAAVNLLSNVIASHYLAPPEGGGRWITTHNHPLPPPVVVQLKQASPAPPSPVKDGMLCCFWALMICDVIQFTSCNYQTLPSHEGASGVRHLHVMAGCPAALHWFTTLVFHTILNLLSMLPAVFFCALFIDKDNTLGQPDLLIYLTVIITLGSIAIFGLLYTLSLCFAERTAAVLAYVFVLLFGSCIPIMQLGVDLFGEKLNIFQRLVLEVFELLIPSQTMTVAVAKVVNVGRLNALCKVNKGNCPDFTVEDIPGFNKDKCCAGETSSYFAFNQYSPGKEMLIMIAQGIVYMVIVVKIQQGYFNCLYDRVRNANFKADDTSSPDEFVADEIEYVASEIEMSKSKIEADDEALLVSGLHKNFPGLCGRKRMYAVRGISFSVQKGECFGLLGTNGAGKSTTFKMLAAEDCPTKGTIFSSQYFLHEGKVKYLSTVGYCPQFMGIDDFLTGNDNLRTMLTIRGLHNNDIDEEVSTWIDVVGLKKYENTIASQYSGGYMRRLAAATALCYGAPLSLLDEPTAGVDVGARHRVHAALRKSLCQNRSIVITSHSMDEMETLCARIAIMVNGQIRALGTPAELRSKYAQGYAVMFKITPYHSKSETSENIKVDNLKKTMAKTFDCYLKDEHMTMLHYHIDNKLSYSELFLKIEQIRQSYNNLIEDYSVSETTLEEVFLHLAKEDIREDREVANEVRAECGSLTCIGNKRLVEATCDPRACQYLAQRISIAIQYIEAMQPALGTLPTGIDMDQLSYL